MSPSVPLCLPVFSALSVMDFRFLCKLSIIGLIIMLLLLSGDIENNPGPRQENMSICHINIQGLSELKLAAIYSHVGRCCDIITLSETFLKVSTNFPLELGGFQPIIRRDRSYSAERLMPFNRYGWSYCS